MRPRSPTAAKVMAAVISWPLASRDLTVAIASPAVTAVTVPGRRLRMLRRMAGLQFTTVY